MNAIASLLDFCRRLVREALNLDWTKLQFIHGQEALATTLLLLLLSFVAWRIKKTRDAVPGQSHITLPALLPSMTTGSKGVLRHLAITFVVVGLPFFLIALADPFSTFVKQEVNHVGRRILILIDASGSMGGGTYGNRFTSSGKLNARSTEPFYTAAAAAEYFVRTRVKSGYKDLIGLIAFGDESYILSPFSSDYENILIGLRLFSDPEEYKLFDDSGTKIAMAINQAARLFKTFGFHKSADNVIILISDGEDMQVVHEGRSIESILAESGENKIPIFFIRTVSGKALGDPSTRDDLWKAAVEKTGGRLYAGADEDAIIRACEEINQQAIGSIQYNRYSSHIPQFQFFAFLAMLFWLAAIVLWSTFRYFRTFP